MADRGKVIVVLNDGDYVYEFNKEDISYTKIEKIKEYYERISKYVYEGVRLNIYLKTQKDPIKILFNINSNTTLEDVLKTAEYYKNLCK